MTTQIKSIRVKTTEEGDEVDDIQIVKETKSKRKCLVMIGCGIILVLALTTSILSLVLFCQTQSSPNTTNEQAVDILDNLAIVSNFTESDLDSFDTAFNVFDYDGDGFLDESEFGAYFGIEMSNSTTYGRIDVDNDTILSYPEVVTYLSEMIKIEYLFDTYFTHNVIPAVKMQYDYDYSDSDPLFIEYAAMSIYFDVFDIDSNGYIRYDEYLSIASQDDFNFADGDTDGKLSKDELFNLLYGHDGHSFSGAIKGLFAAENGTDVNKLIESLNSITLTMEQVSNVQIDLCPIKHSSNAAQRRRLEKTCAVTVIVRTKKKTHYFNLFCHA